jgi:ferredoxin
MPTITIDNRTVQVADGATILDAARALGIEIPTLCHMDGLPPSTSCLVCVVRVDGARRLVPSCATQVREGMVVESETDEVRSARRMALELLLGDHLGDCLAPCQVACPAGMDVALMLRHLAAGDRHEAATVARDALVLPGTLGRICPAPCERVCRRGQVDEPVPIRSLHRSAADADLSADAVTLPDCAPPTGKRVAVVGAGPAGLSAAWSLLRAGHEAVVFDAADRAGGALRSEDLAARLHEDLLDAEIEVVVRLGAELRLGERVTLDDVRAGHDAVVVACGEVDEAAAAALGLPMSGRGLAADWSTGATDLPGVFACGSAISPGRMAVRAVASGARAAAATDAWLRGDELPAGGREFNVVMGRLEPDELAVFAADAADGPSVAEVLPAGRSASEAAAEAARCLRCDCRALDDCALRRYAIEYGASPTRHACERRRFERDTTHPRVVYESGKCIDCGLCVAIASRAGEELGLTFVGRGFDVRVAVPFGEGIAEGLTRVAAECVAACPTGALTMRR